MCPEGMLNVYNARDCPTQNVPITLSAGHLMRAGVGTGISVRMALSLTFSVLSFQGSDRPGCGFNRQVRGRDNQLSIVLITTV